VLICLLSNSCSQLLRHVHMQSGIKQHFISAGVKCFEAGQLYLTASCNFTSKCEKLCPQRKERVFPAVLRT